MDSRDFQLERSQSPEPIEGETGDQLTKEISAEAGPGARPKRPSKVVSWKSADFRDFHPPPRTNTILSSSSSKLEPPWQKQFVLSLDGGGIRGYSSLLIVRKLIDLIAEIEIVTQANTFEGSETHTSFSPIPPPIPLSDDSSDDGDTGLKEINKRKNVFSKAQKQKSSSGTSDAEDQARRRRSRYLPCHYFDYIAGTSTGGLIAIMLSRLRLPIDDALDQYEIFGGYIFGHPRFFSIRPSWSRPIPLLREKYNSKRLVHVIKEVVKKQISKKASLLGQDLFTSHDRMCKTLVVSFGGQKVEDETAREGEPPYLFRSYDHHPFVSNDPNYLSGFERNPGYSQRIPIWQVARATTAAPTYFKSIKINNCKYGDGGFGRNNPVRELYYDVCQMNGNGKKDMGMVLSIGTGLPKRTWRYGQDGIGRFLGYIKTTKRLASDSEVEHQEMRRLVADTSTVGYRIPYHRFNVPYKQAAEEVEIQHSGANANTNDTTSNGVANGGTSNNQEPKLPEPKRRKRDKIGPTRIKRLGDMKLDEWKPSSRLLGRKCNTTLRDITSATNIYLSDPAVDKELREVAKVLVDSRQARCTTPHWELYSTGNQFRCMFHGCHSAKSQKMRPHPQSLRSHLAKVHGVIIEEELDDFVTRGRCLY